MSTATTAPKVDADVSKTGSTLTGRFTVKNLPSVSLPTVSLDEVKKPAFAAVGVADLALEQVKDVPAELQAKATERTSTVQAQVKALPAQVKALPEQASTKATEVRGTVEAQVKAFRTDVEARVAKAQETAQTTYATLVTRGERLVGQIRRQPSTAAAIAEGKEAVKKAEAAANAAKKSAKAGAQATEDAAAKLG